jgi:hypothetical protein
MFRVTFWTTLKPETGTTQNKCPHDKKYTVHSKEKETQSWRHIQEGKKKHIKTKN